MIVSQTKIFELDDNIAEHIVKLNNKGYLTEYSCSGHIDKKTLGYISFEVFTSNFLKKHDIEPPKNWFYSYFSMDKRLGMYMDKTNDDNFVDTEEFTQEYLDNRLKDLMEWVDSLPVKNLPYIYSIHTEVLDGEHNGDMQQVFNSEN